MNNKVRYGLRNAYYAKLDEAAGTYGSPVRLPGAVALELTPEGEETPFYADDIKYFVATANNGYTGSLELAYLSDDAKIDLLGFEEDDNGLVVEGPDDTQSPFALLYEVQGDVAGRRYAFFNVRMSRPSESRATKGESTTPKTESANITVLPYEFDERMCTKASVEYSAATAAVYGGWFTAVKRPDFGAA
jgi:phi13 family phage major tail protein